MITTSRIFLGCLGATWLLSACLDTASVDNDNDRSAPSRSAVEGTAAGRSAPSAAAGKAAQPPAAGKNGAGGKTGGAGKGNPDSPAGKGGAAGAPSGDGGRTSTEAGAAGRDDKPVAGSSSGAADPSLVAGTATAAGCSSYQRPANGMCGGYFCGVDQATLAKALDPGGECTSDAAFVCDGRLVNKVGECARRIKSQMVFASNDELRGPTQDCVYEDPEFNGKVPEQCLGCFLDAAICAGDKCLLQCLQGDSSMCDQCRLDNNCEQPVFPCTGLPSPL